MDWNPLDYKDAITSSKTAKQRGKTGLFSEGTAQIHFIMGLESYKTLAIALQILLTPSVSVAAYERSFSKMKLTKSYLIPTMLQDTHNPCCSFN
jgi:hypothetical protein